jgi:hypothetical protein
MVAVVGMRRGDLVRDAVGGGHAAHRDGGFPRLRSVIYFRKNVGMNVYHGLYEPKRSVQVASNLI